MSHWTKMAGALVSLALTAQALAQPQPMTKEEIASAIRSEAVLIPIPGEFFAAIDKEGKRNWPSLMRNIPSPTTGNRAQMALNLGTLIADGYISVEAQDSQQVKNVGRDILSIAKTLGVSQDIINRGQSIADFAENNDWLGLKEELEATQNEVKLSMARQQDQSLITLVNLGAWLRGIQAASTLINRDYSPDAAKLLRQPAVVDFLLEHVEALPARIKEDPLVVRVKSALTSTLTQINGPRDAAPTPEAVQEIHTTTTLLVDDISGVTPTPTPEAEPAPAQ